MLRFIFHRRTLILMLLVLLALPSGAALAQSKAFIYDRINVDLDVRSDGTLDVAEMITLRYTGGPFSSASRSLALTRLDEVRDVRLSEGQRTYAEASSGKTPGTLTAVQADGKLKVSWYYEPTSDASRTFTLRYRVLGAVRVSSEADEVWWVAIFPDRSVPVQHAQVSMRLPDGAKLRAQDVTLPAAAGKIQITDNRVVVTRDEALPPGQSLDLRVDFNPALVSAQPPAWQSAAPSQAEEPEAQSQPIGTLGWLIGGSFAMLSCFGVPLMVVVVLVLVIRALLRNAGKPHSAPPIGWSNTTNSSSSWSNTTNSGSSWSSSDSSSSWSSSDSGSSWSDSGGSGGGGGDAG